MRNSKGSYMKETGLRVFCVFFIVVFTCLGAWQYHRYQYKTILFSEHAKNQQAKPVLFSESTQHPFEVAHVKGHYVNQFTVLLHNRYHDGQLGVEVLTPIEIKNDKRLLLVDRGWARDPQNSTVMGEQSITGSIYPFHEYQFILGDTILSGSDSFIKMQRMDFKALEHVTHHLFYPVTLRLAADQPHGFVRDWVIATVSPARHLGYAVQWWVMALVLLSIFIYQWVMHEKK